MTDVDLPPVPDSSEAGLVAIHYQGEVDVYKQDRQASQELTKTEYETTLALAKADYDAEIATARADADAEIATAKADYDAEIATASADSDAEIASQGAFHQALIDVSKASVDRSRSAAEAVRNAAAAIGVIYGTVLGVAFSVDRPIPPRGLIPAVFLGIAIVFATAYTAFLARSDDSTHWPDETDGRPVNSKNRTTTFMQWAASAVFRRAYALRAAVLALGFGVLFLPVGFIAVGSTSAAAAKTSWPAPPTQIANPDLQAILFQAQVDEAAQQREQELNSSPGEQLDSYPIGVFYGVAVLCLILTFCIPLFWLKGDHRTTDPPDIPPLAEEA